VKKMGIRIVYRTLQDNIHDQETLEDGEPKGEGFYWSQTDPFGWRLTDWDGPYKTHEDAAKAAGAD